MLGALYTTPAAKAETLSGSRGAPVSVGVGVGEGAGLAVLVAVGVAADVRAAELDGPLAQPAVDKAKMISTARRFNRFPQRLVVS